MASEKRLTDIDALLEKVTKLVANSGNTAETVGKIIIAITDAPIADAVEVVHAYWVGDEPGDWHCSHCGEYAADGGFEQTKYCPNCGAKMDGDGNEP